MITVDKIRVQYHPLQKDARYRITDAERPAFSWSVCSDTANDRQEACRVRCFGDDGRLLWDSEWREQNAQELICDVALPKEERITASVAVRGRAEESGETREYFYVSALSDYTPRWIARADEEKERVQYFRRELSIEKPIKRATVYVSGIGLHELEINGTRPDESYLDPIVSNYKKCTYFVMHPEVEGLFQQGSNVISVQVADGWRRNEGEYVDLIKDRKIEFFGSPCLSLILHLQYENGEDEVVSTDHSWLVGYGAIVQANLFNGETYDASAAIPHWNEVGVTPESFVHATEVEAPSENVKTSIEQPIRAGECYRPKSILRHGDGTVLVDFGQNVAGTVRVNLPKSLHGGDRVSIFHGEILETDGRISGATIRRAQNRDTYLAAGDERDLAVWQPKFTYHGFRYVEVSGYPTLTKEDITAVAFYNDVALESSFTCGNATVNAIGNMIAQTEKANIHGIFTDCPQRDERMGWMNDATVRFEETPYQFDVGTLFPKIVRDIANEQGEDGAITCTAPYVYGARPADPVSSSFLIAALQAYRYTGNTEVIREHYEAFEKWQECLTARAENGIVKYSLYGDWAAPVYACVNGERSINAVKNLYTSGEFMSTGYYYLNARLLSELAETIGNAEKAEQYRKMAERIKATMLEKWWDAESGRMASGSQGCQSFALWLGIIPKEHRARAAEVLREDLVSRGYKITTGNLTTRYLYDVLTEYGYVDDAWRLITADEYPSIGYMLRHGATTVWERFELKRDISMNSHCHPMYGAVGYWLYAYIAGIRFEGASCERVKIKPYFPKGLDFVAATVETVRGEVSVRWMRRFGEFSLIVSVPFGMTAEILFDGETRTVGSGLTVIKKAAPEDCYLRIEN